MSETLIRLLGVLWFTTITLVVATAVGVHPMSVTIPLWVLYALLYGVASFTVVAWVRYW